MSTRKYIYKKRDKFSDPIGLRRLRAVAATRIVLGKGPFAITQDGNLVAKGLTRYKAIKRVILLVRYRDIGSTFRVRKGDGKVVFTCRAVLVDTVPTTDSTSGNSKADFYWNWVQAKFKEYKPRYAGAYVCKYIAGSGTRSQHSYGNAVDVFFDTIAHQEQVANAVVANANLLRPYHVISTGRIWTKGGGWKPYGGVYHSHLHVDFDPQQSGYCGVK